MYLENGLDSVKKIFKDLETFNCAKVVKNKEEMEKEFDKLLSDGEYYNNMKKNCAEVFAQNKGATDYLYNFIKTL